MKGALLLGLIVVVLIAPSGAFAQLCDGRQPTIVAPEPERSEEDVCLLYDEEYDDDCISWGTIVIWSTLVFGTDGQDVILGSWGDDAIFGNGGGDIICSGEGNDTIFGEAEAGQIDIIYAGPGDDFIFCYGQCVADGEAGNDEFFPGPAGGWFIGGDGDDTFVLYKGPDVVAGGAGHDRAIFVGPEDNISIDVEEIF